jgi:hypothetical protein
MIKNIPNKYTIQDLSAEINSVFGDTYDFLYLPCDSKVNLFFNFRIIAMLDMVSLILSIHNI